MSAVLRRSPRRFLAERDAHKVCELPGVSGFFVSDTLRLHVSGDVLTVPDDDQQIVS